MAESERERDLVLNPNEYSYVLDKTKGLISCVTGPYKMSLSASDALVDFNETTKRFEEVPFNKASKTFVSAPENWYVVLKNPAKGNQHPVPGKSNELPDLEIGKKVNIPGNITFALYPGQMAKIIPGHSLRSNQYLLTRVYDAKLFGQVDILGDDGEPTGDKRDRYVNGQLLVIKGTDVSFYIPQTGMEVVPADNDGNYIREAVTLKKLEYCILNKEDGNKKYVYGPAVVFPEPDEQFEVNTSSGNYTFKAIELSEIRGVYVKVNSDYCDVITSQKEDEDGVLEDVKTEIWHKTGDELFITGKDQAIYYPRPEHTFIDYDGRIVYYATAIPKGEGRYVMNRKTGEIKTVLGPVMYLPDPREEVFVQRKLTERECRTWYPGNNEVLRFNCGDEKAKAALDSIDQQLRSMTCCSSAGQPVVTADTLSRSTNYTKPRMISFDSKYDGAVRIEVWSGYAVNVISKDGNRKTIIGPFTYVLNYDETLEEIDGKVYLYIEESTVEEHLVSRTTDLVDVQFDVSYMVKFDSKEKDKWFRVRDYVSLIWERIGHTINDTVRHTKFEDFYSNASNIIREVVFGNMGVGEIHFPENGMVVTNIVINNVECIGNDTYNMLRNHQKEIAKQTFELSVLEKEAILAKEIAKAEKEKADAVHESQLYAIQLETEYKEKAFDLVRKDEECQKAKKEAELELKKIELLVQKSVLEQEKDKEEQNLLFKSKNNSLDIEKQKAYTDNVKKIVDSISPDLIASMTANANAELLEVLASAMGPYAIARGESVASVTNLLLRGTPLEGIIEQINTKIRNANSEVMVNNKDGKVVASSKTNNSKSYKKTPGTQSALSE